jgi:hypothetical protein
MAEERTFGLLFIAGSSARSICVEPMVYVTETSDCVAGSMVWV